MEKEIINKINKNISVYKKFVYPDYPDLGIFANQYKDILLKVYENSKEPYTVIYSDVNKLSVINERYGKETGDKILYKLLENFTKSQALTEKSSTIRLGGDEFITFIPNVTKDEVSTKLNAAQIEFERKSSELLGSGITFGVEDSVSQKNIDSVILEAEKQVEEQKQKRRKKDSFLREAKNSDSFVELTIPQDISEEQKNKWELLNNKINTAVDNHLRDIRPSSSIFEYNINNIKPDMKSIVFSIGNLISNSAKVENKEDEQQEKSELLLSDENAPIIHALFRGEKIDLSQYEDTRLDEIYQELENIGESFVRNKHSGLLSKSYFKIFLADELLKSKQNYQAIYFSLIGIRPSNTAVGHTATDKKIAKTIIPFIKDINEITEFNDKPFTFDKEDTFFIDQDGGNYVIFIPMDRALDNEKMEKIVKKVNSRYKDSLNTSFQMSYAYKNNVNKNMIAMYVNSIDEIKNTPLEILRTMYQTIKEKNNNSSDKKLPYRIYDGKPFVKFARRLKQTCNSKKDSIKMDCLSGKINQKALEANFSDCINYYLTELEGAYTNKMQKVLLENIMVALANHEVYINAMTKKNFQNKIESRKTFGRKSTELDNR